MQFNLVVVRPFANYRRGDVVKLESEIATILSGEHALSVVRIPATETANTTKGV
jgi:hypothetical protein